MSNLTTHERNYIINYLKTTHWNNSPWFMFSDKDGRFWKLEHANMPHGFVSIASDNKYNFVWDEKRNNYRQTSAGFRGFYVDDDHSIWNTTRRDLLSAEGYNKDKYTHETPVKSDSEYYNYNSKGDYNNWENTDKSQVRKPPELTNGIGKPNYLPGYSRLSGNPHFSAYTNTNFPGGGFLIMDRGTGKTNQAFIIYALIQDKDKYANDILINHPQIVNTIINNYRNNCNNSNIRQLCLDDGGTTRAGTKFMTLSECSVDNINQLFKYEKDTGLIKSIKKQDICIDDGGGTTAGGTYVWTHTCNSNNKNQQFEYNPNTKLIKNKTKNLCLDDIGANSAGSNLWLHTCDPNNINQQFDIDPVTGLIRSVNKFSDIICKEFCLKTENQNKCQDSLKTFCNNFNNVNTPICKEWCGKIDNKGKCDEAAIAYCRKNLNDDVFCGCFEDNARHQIPRDVAETYFGSNNPAFCWQKNCIPIGYKTHSLEQTLKLTNPCPKCYQVSTNNKVNTEFNNNSNIAVNLSQSCNVSEGKTTLETTSKPTTQTASQPATQPTSQPASQQVSKPVTQPTSQPASSQVSKSVSQPVVKQSDNLQNTIDNIKNWKYDINYNNSVYTLELIHLIILVIIFVLLIKTITTKKQKSIIIQPSAPPAYYMN
jgi:hypothetical protein